MTLENLFNPKSVALIGVSGNPKKRSGVPLKVLLNSGFSGNIYPINPKYDEIEGIRCYKSIKEARSSGEIDVALILLPAKLVPKTLQECGEVGIKYAIVIAAGFSEIGGSGKSLQEELVDTARRYDIRVVGPNCVGLVSCHSKFAATYLGIDELIPGHVSIISQSGGLSGLIYFIAKARKIGLSHLISSGNEADLTTLDYIDYLIDDDKTKVIACYLEGLKEGSGERAKLIAKKALMSKKPIIVLKVGRSKKGSEAALSHTASMAGSDIAYNAFFKQYGLIRVNDIDELLDTAAFLSRYSVLKRYNVGLVSMSGGATVEFADAAEEAGINLPDFDDGTVQKLREILPERVLVKNPLDLAGAVDPPAYEKILEIISNDKNIDVVVFFNAWWYERARESADSIANANKAIKKPVIVVWNAPKEITNGGIDKLENEGLIVLPSIRRCISVLRAAKFYSEHIYSEAPNLNSINTNKSGKQTLKDYFERGLTILTEKESKDVLGEYSLPVVNEGLAQTIDEAIEIADQIGYPVAVKVCSREVAHKTELGLVKLDIKDSNELKSAYIEIFKKVKNLGISIDGILIQEYLKGDVELIIGVSEDRVFGHLIMFGLGGYYTELYQDVSFKTIPITPKDAHLMVKETRIGKLFEKGYRGKKFDIQMIVDVLLKTSNFVHSNKRWLSELDINPLVVSEDGAKIVDALIRIKGV